MKRLILNRLHIWALAFVLGVPFYSFSAETNPPARLKQDSTPINRDLRGGHSYAPVIKNASASVVNISVTQTVRPQRFHRFLDARCSSDSSGTARERAETGPFRGRARVRVSL